MAIQLLFMGCCFQDLFSISRSILVQFLSSFFSIHFVNIHVVHPYRNDTTPALKKLHFILSDMSNYHKINNQSIAVHTFTRCILMSLSVDETLPPRYLYSLSTNFREPPFSVEMSHS